MKRLVGVSFIVLFLLQSSLVGAVTPLTLTEAKTLAVENARALQNLGNTVEQLRLRVDLAKDIYEANDVYKKYKNTLNYLVILNQEVEELEVKYAAAMDGTPEKASLLERLQGHLQMVAMEKAKIAAYKAQMAASSSDSQLEKMWDEARDQYEDIQVTYEQASKQMELGIEKLFFGLYYQQFSLDILEKVQQLQNLNKEIALVSQKLGLATIVDLQRAESALVGTAKSLADLRGSLKDTTWKLNDLMGQKVSTPLRIVVPLYTPEKSEKSFNEVLKICLANDASIPQKERDLERLEKDYRDATDKNERAIMAVEIEKAGLDLVETRQVIEERVKDVLGGLDTQYKAWQAAVYQKEEAELNQRLAGYLYEQGLISRLEKLNSELALRQAILGEVQATFNHFMLVTELELVELGIVVSSF